MKSSLILKTTVFAILIFFLMAATVDAATDSDQPLCSLSAQVFDADGKEIQDKSPEIQVFVFLWQKIVDGTVVQGTPMLHSSDGSSWQRIGEFYLRRATYSTEWSVKKDVPPGEYRFSFTISKNFSRGRGGLLPSVGGYTGPKQTHGWGLSDIITVTAEDTKKTLELRPDAGPKVRLRTTFFPDPATVAATDTISKEENEVLSERFWEANQITMRVFRDENFPTDAFSESGGYGVRHIDRGIPWYIDFDQMKPGKYYAHFYQGTSPPGAATTAAMDVFAFEVTEDGTNEFVFTPEKSLTENATWQVAGTVRDENGDPVPNTWVTLTDPFPGDSSSSRIGEHVASVTDTEGKYRLVVNPFSVQSGVVFDAETKQWRWGFRLQQAQITIGRFYGLDGVSANDLKTDVIFLGEFATDELKQQLAERPEKMILVAMNEPAVVDFNISSQSLQKVLASSRLDWREANDDPERRRLRFEALERRKTFNDSDSQKLFREIVLPNSLNQDYIEAEAIGAQISVTLTTAKPVFMLNEPMELAFNIANGSEYDVSVMTDENMGVPTLVWAVSDDGDIFLESERWGTMHSGPVQYRRIRPHDSLPYRIFMPDKFAFSKPGRYTINVARNLMVKRIEPPTDDRDYVFWNPLAPERWTEVMVPVFASITIDVVPTDSVELGKQIDALVEVIQSREMTKKYGEASKALEILCAIDDERAVPCLVAEVREDNYNYAFHAIGALSKFKSDAAFEGIKKALTFSDYNLLLTAAYALSGSKHPQAIPELLKNENHPHYVVRLIVVQSAEKMDRETALEMLQRHFDDPGGYVGNNNEHFTDVAKEARRIYDELVSSE